jgi:hypothetical protein
MTTREINRAALTVIPKQLFIDWVSLHDSAATPLAVNDLRDEVTVYLVDEVLIEADVAKALKRHYAAIFEQELAAWYSDKRRWPQQRDLRTFKRWFDVKVSSVVIDLSDHHLAVEEFED